MPWTETTRVQYQRDGLRYASNTTDGEWAILGPLLPPPCRVGRPRTADLREVLNGILFVLRSGCQWRMLPKDFPPRSTVQRSFYQWRDWGVWALPVVVNALTRATTWDGFLAALPDIELLRLQPSSVPQSLDATEIIRHDRDRDHINVEL